MVFFTYRSVSEIEYILDASCQVGIPQLIRWAMKLVKLA
jgi:hypothetical protein